MPGTLPENWPEARQCKTRTPKAADPEPMAEKTGQDAIPSAEDDPEDESLPERMEVHFDVEGSARKALPHAIGKGIGAYPSCKAAPSFTYTIGEYTLDRHGILTGPHNACLLGCLAQDGYQTK